MTPQQAGVSAEAAAKLVEKWRSGNCGASENELVKVSHKTFLKCADELEAALATAPPEQAAREDSWSRLERHTKALAKVQPQAVSAGALSGPDGYAFRYPDGIRFTTGEAINGSRPLDSIPYYFESSLAAHDQKVRAEVLEEAMLEEMAMYIALRLPEGLPLRGDRNEAKHVILRLMRAAAPAASKPEAGYE